MAAHDLPWPADNTPDAEAVRIIKGAEPLSREPWNTGTGGGAGKGATAPFPASGEDGSGQGPGEGSRDASLAGSQGSALSPWRGFRVQYLQLLGSIWVFFFSHSFS